MVLIMKAVITFDPVSDVATGRHQVRRIHCLSYRQIYFELIEKICFIQIV